ncbi:hypothetical protein KYC5002_32820 [Archangium violaceum]|nr:hypothetical protein KYC5002_32820 [Archangium gephyra]
MGIKLGGASNLFKGGGNKIPDFKPSAPKPDVKPQCWRCRSRPPAR